MAEPRFLPENDLRGVPAGGIAPSRSGLAQLPRPLLTEAERRVLAAVTERKSLTLGQLRNVTGLGSDELLLVVQSLRKQGHLRRLNTVIESYCCSNHGPRLKVAR